jgi:hypothetical protein
MHKYLTEDHIMNKKVSVDIIAAIFQCFYLAK